MNVAPAEIPNECFEPVARLARLSSRAKGLTTASRVSGTIVRMTPTYFVVAGLSKYVSLGDAVSIAVPNGTILAEVASIDSETINVTPITSHAKVELSARVTAELRPISLAPDESWLGRVIDPLGRPLDTEGPLRPGARMVPLSGGAPQAMRRNRLGGALATGVKAIDLFTPICAGQRMGIFAGSGVGKSTLLSMMSKSIAFDVVVLSLVGERGREVRDFLDDNLAESRHKVTAVVATADESPMMRRLAPSAAMCVAEYFRDQGKSVLLILDSITRFAHAIRELALASQEPPVARGYPPSVFGALPRLLERAGPGEAGAGSITALVSVLVDGDDHNDPISDAVRGILDGHIVLDRDIAAQGRFPAVNPLMSLSRLAPTIRTKTHATFVSQIIELISRFEDTKDLRALGGYRQGSDVVLDRSIDLVPRLYEALKQSLADPSVPDVYGFLATRLQQTPANA